MRANGRHALHGTDSPNVHPIVLRCGRKDVRYDFQFFRRARVGYFNYPDSDRIGNVFRDTETVSAIRGTGNWKDFIGKGFLHGKRLSVIREKLRGFVVYPWW